jgi:hypothetical protein
MAARFLPDTTVRVRRGRRRDLPQVQALLGAPADGRLERARRRMLADLGGDVYVAEDREGAIVGIVSVVYARSLRDGRLAALLDEARVSPAAHPLLAGLIAFAEDRARRRGCRRLAARVDGEEPELRATLLARGYHGGTLLVAELGAPG